MKLYVASDLHIEFGDIHLKNEDNVDVLILSGDILIARDLSRPDERGDRTNQFLKNVSDEFPNTVLIMGNHEHYHGDFADSQKTIQKSLDNQNITNIHLLEKSTWTYNDWLFIGGTLWTDFNSGDFTTLYTAKSSMNDYRQVKNSNVHFYKFIPEHALEDHMKMKNYIMHVINNRRSSGKTDKRVIVVGHHAPSKQSTHPHYQHDTIMNGCYSSNMDDFILDRPEIALWTHGHTHEDFDYMIGSTRIVCNPRGYINYEERADNWKPKLVELE